MDTEIIVIFALCVVTLLSVALPTTYTYLKDKRDAEARERKEQAELKEREKDKERESEDRRKRELDLVSYIDGLLKLDGTLDYVFADRQDMTAKDKECKIEHYQKIAEMIKPKPDKKAA